MKKSIFYLISIIVLCCGVVGVIVVTYIQTDDSYTYTSYQDVDNIDLQTFDPTKYTELKVTRQNLQYFEKASGVVECGNIETLYNTFTVSATEKKLGDTVVIDEDLDSGSETVRSTINGKIVELIYADDSVNVVVMNCECFVVSVSIDIKHYAKINYDSVVKVKVSEHFYEGKVTHIGYELNPDNTFNVCIQITDSENNILLGQLCDVYVCVGNDDNILVVKNIFADQKEVKTLMKRERDGKVIYVEYNLTLGNAGLENIAVVSAIEEGAVLYVSK